MGKEFCLDTKSMVHERKKIIWGPYQNLKKICSAQEPINKSKRQDTKLEKIFVNLISSKRQLTGICKELSKLSSKETQNCPFRKWAKIWTDISLKNICIWQISTWKFVQHYLKSLIKCKLKPQWGITAHLSEWLDKN